MPSFSVQLPVGAVADTNELEYIAALHQTDDDVNANWIDASIEAVDLKRFLLSKYDIDVTEEQVRDIIFNGLAGGNDEDDCLDLVEVTAILLIPIFLKLQRQHQKINHNDNDSGNGNGNTNTNSRTSIADSLNAEHDTFLQHQDKDIVIDDAGDESKLDPTTIQKVLDIILLDTFGSTDPPPLTKETLRSIFAHYQEIELIHDESLVQDMIDAALTLFPENNQELNDEEACTTTLSSSRSGTTSVPLLNEDAFVRALTSDIQLYDLDKEYKRSTNYEDAFGQDEDDTQPTQQQKENYKIHRYLPFASSLDFIGDSFYSILHLLCSWLILVLFVLIFWDPFKEKKLLKYCDSDTFGCQIAQKVAFWLTVMALLIVTGTIAVSLLSFGNSDKVNILHVFIGLGAIALTCFVPVFVPFKLILFEGFGPGGLTINNNATYTAQLWIYLLIGGTLVLIQFQNLLRVFAFNKTRLINFIRKYLGGHRATYEWSMKQAANCKLSRMINNALSLHNEKGLVYNSAPSFEKLNKSTRSTAISNYNDERYESEEWGSGIYWMYKQYFNKSILQKEGISIPARIKAATLSLIIFGIGLMTITITTSISLVELFYPKKPVYSDCVFTFKPETCNYPKANEIYFGFGICEVEPHDAACITLNSWELMVDGNDLCAQLKLLGPNFNCTENLPGWSNQTDVFRATDYFFAVTPDSTERNYCSASIYACSYDGVSGICVLGLEKNDLLIPLSHQFEGTTCSSYEPIPEIIDQDPSRALQDFVPQRWTLRLCGALGIIFSTLTFFSIACCYVPSVIRTKMALRSGVIATLRNPLFNQIRGSMYSLSYLLGVIIWSDFIMSAIVYVIVYLGVFVLTWDVLRDVLFWVLGLAIGIAITSVIKIILMTVFQKMCFVGLYRIRPVFANFTMLAFESWHLGLGFAPVISRVTKLVIVSILNGGKVDVPVFSGEGLGGGMDKLPSYFLKCLIAHDAHNHPYMERLGLMYMMKLRHRDKFARQAGSIWRLLFVFALMPWLQRYRLKEIGDFDLADLKSFFASSSGGSEREAIALLLEENQRLKARIMEMEGNPKRVASGECEGIKNYKDAFSYTDDKSIGDVSFTDEDD